MHPIFRGLGRAFRRNHSSNRVRLQSDHVPGLFHWGATALYLSFLREVDELGEKSRGRDTALEGESVSDNLGSSRAIWPPVVHVRTAPVTVAPTSAPKDVEPPVVCRFVAKDQWSPLACPCGWPATKGDCEADPIGHVQGDAAARKAQPVARGCLDYFPDALLAVAELSQVGNDQHNPGQPLHWAKEKSTDEADALLRHLIDRGTRDTDGQRHSAKVAWRALALLQREIEAERMA